MKEVLNNMYPEDEHKLSATFSDIYSTKRNPPTHFKLTEVLEVHQLIVDTYGVPSYKEVNPALFNVVTFPFLFGIMFGDVGHGLILLSVVIVMFHQNRNGYELIPKEYIHGRWILLLMAIFSIFIGFLYNDFFAISMDFGSCYVEDLVTKTAIKKADCVYPFGLDPAWTGDLASNSKAFVNSIKMKFAITIGILQMTLGK